MGLPSIFVPWGLYPVDLLLAAPLWFTIPTASFMQVSLPVYTGKGIIQYLACCVRLVCWPTQAAIGEWRRRKRTVNTRDGNDDGRKSMWILGTNVMEGIMTRLFSLRMPLIYQMRRLVLGQVSYRYCHLLFENDYNFGKLTEKRSFRSLLTSYIILKRSYSKIIHISRSFIFLKRSYYLNVYNFRTITFFNHSYFYKTFIFWKQCLSSTFLKRSYFKNVQIFKTFIFLKHSHF